MKDTVYLDNSATSWPKPSGVYRAMAAFMAECGGSAGRSSHRRAIEAGLEIYRAREAVAELLGVEKPNRVIFGHNATWALNQAIGGLLRPGDRVIADRSSHNSVRRPLLALERGAGIRIDWWAPPSAAEPLDPAELDALLSKEPTRLVTVCHISNVLGTIEPLAEICATAHRHGALVLADCAQSAGSLPLELDAWGVDFAAFTGHKSLLGPQGTGGLVIGPDLTLEPLMRGGGGDSRAEDVPPELPEALEAGTYNAVGLAGLRAGIAWIRERGLDTLLEHKRKLTRRLLELLDEASAELLGPRDPALRGALVSFNLPGWEANQLAAALEENHGVQTRSGLHCAPGAHHLALTMDRGAVRASVGPFNTEEDLEVLARAVAAARRETP